MKIVILGAGSVGVYAASALSQEQHDITLIDADPQRIEHVSRNYDVAAILARMPDVSLLSQLLENSPDLFFAATNDDETNLVSCALAKNLGFPKAVARIQSSLDIKRLFSIDHQIHPEMLAAQDIFKLLIHPQDAAFEHFACGAVTMRTIRIPNEWRQKDIPIKDLKLPKGLIAGLIRRKEEIVFPHGSDFLHPEDEVTVIGESESMNNLHSLFQIREKRIKSILLVGGSEIALHLARFLIRERVSVRIVESNPLRCRELADLLPRATVINRNGQDLNLLREEEVEAADALVSCTGNEGTDFLVSSLAVHLGCPKVIALSSDPAYIPLFEKAGVIPATSYCIHAINRLLTILHESSLLSVRSLPNDVAKIVELKISINSGLIGKPLSDLHLPKDLLIAVIENHGKVMVGHGASILCSEDTVVAICSSHRLEHLHHIFQ